MKRKPMAYVIFMWVVSKDGLGRWSECRVEKLTINALSYGNDFMPSCQGIAAVILQPVDANGVKIAQTGIIEIPVPNCDYSSDETAWGGYFDTTNGFKFPGKNWATGFAITIGL